MKIHPIHLDTVHQSLTIPTNRECSIYSLSCCLFEPPGGLEIRPCARIRWSACSVRRTLLTTRQIRVIKIEGICMSADVLDRARAKCGTRDRKCLGGDREAARWHARLQLSLRWHGLEG